MPRERKDQLVGFSIDPDAETLQGAAFRFRCVPIRRSYSTANYGAYEESATVDSPEALGVWLRSMLTPLKETP